MQQQYSTAGSQYSGPRGAPNTSRQYMQNKPVKRPRFHPAAIIILVLSIGLVFVGLVMTIISVWPGYAPQGGNPLKIVGPVLLCLGFVVLMATIYYSCYFTKRRNRAMMNMSRRPEQGMPPNRFDPQSAHPLSNSGGEATMDV